MHTNSTAHSLRSACARAFGLMLMAAVVTPLYGQSESPSMKAVIPLVQFVRDHATVGLREATSDSVLVEVGDLVPGISSATLDSLQRLSVFQLGVNGSTDCIDGRERTAVLARAQCALTEYEHYVEVRAFVARDSAAEATIVIARRATGPRPGRGVRASVASAVSRAVGRGTAARASLSFQTFVAHLILTDRGEWVVRDMAIPTLRKAPVHHDTLPSPVIHERVQSSS
jgi:hypothetical protein